MLKTSRSIYRRFCRLAGLFSLFALGTATTGDPAYLGFLAFAAFPLLGDHPSRSKAPVS